MGVDKFARFDYGSVENLIVYNQTSPPNYPLDHIIDFPIGFFTGLSDELADPKDVAWLSQ